MVGIGEVELDHLDPIHPAAAPAIGEGPAQTSVGPGIAKAHHLHLMARLRQGAGQGVRAGAGSTSWRGEVLVVIVNFHKQEISGRELNGRGEDCRSLSDAHLQHRQWRFGAIVAGFPTRHQRQAGDGLIAADLQCGQRSNHGISFQAPLCRAQTPAQQSLVLEAGASVGDDPTLAGGIELHLSLMAAMGAAVSSGDGAGLQLRRSFQLQPVAPQEAAEAGHGLSAIELHGVVASDAGEDGEIFKGSVVGVAAAVAQQIHTLMP